jgi:crotonobetainyl-CoA:carnitine CoA-transferase CaiB-like acyl-CoA transferase
MKQGALADLQVVDLTQMLAGPLCTQFLADQGAKVIKVEPPGGDGIRKSGPFRVDDELRAFGGYFASVNRNKRSIVIDLKQERGKEVLRRLIARSDVVVENFRAGVMDRLGLSYESLALENPALVYAAIRGFGDPRTGLSPYADWPAYDVVSQAMGGMMGITGEAADRPLKTGPGVGDIVPGLMLGIGILSAVHHARRTGQGQFVDVGMTDAVLAICERIVYQYSYERRSPRPEGNRHPLLCPFGLFPAREGWVSIACPSDQFWKHLASAMGQPELGLDPRYATNADRLAHADAVIDLVSAFTSCHTKDELQRLLGGRVPFGPVLAAQEIFDDPHFRAREMIIGIEHPGCAEPVDIAGTPIKLSKTPGGVRSRAPLLGEHSVEILSRMGQDERVICELLRDGVVVQLEPGPDPLR